MSARWYVERRWVCWGIAREYGFETFRCWLGDCDSGRMESVMNGFDRDIVGFEDVWKYARGWFCWG